MINLGKRKGDWFLDRIGQLGSEYFVYLTIGLKAWRTRQVNPSSVLDPPRPLSPVALHEAVSMRARGSRDMRRALRDTHRSDEQAGGVESPLAAPGSTRGPSLSRQRAPRANR